MVQEVDIGRARLLDGAVCDGVFDSEGTCSYHSVAGFRVSFSVEPRIDKAGTAVVVEGLETTDINYLGVAVLTTCELAEKWLTRAIVRKHLRLD